jgi:hypothetical protein
MPRGRRKASSKVGEAVGSVMDYLKLTPCSQANGAPNSTYTVKALRDLIEVTGAVSWSDVVHLKDATITVSPFKEGKWWYNAQVAYPCARGQSLEPNDRNLWSIRVNGTVNKWMDLTILSPHHAPFKELENKGWALHASISRAYKLLNDVRIVFKLRLAAIAQIAFVATVFPVPPAPVARITAGGWCDGEFGWRK